MPDHAGYAVAITVRTQALNESFRRAYHVGKNGRSIVGAFMPTPASGVTARLFFGPPQVTLSQSAPEHATVRLTGWGTISIRTNPPPSPVETRAIQWTSRLLVKHEASVSPSSVNVRLTAGKFELFIWQFDVLGDTDFSAAANAILNGDPFKDRLQTWLRAAIRDFDFRIDISVFGRIPATEVLTVDTRSVPGALMVGVDAPIVSNGNPLLLHDFAGDNDIALYINSTVLPLMLQEMQQRVADKVAEEGATLEGDLDFSTEEGRFRVRGRASVKYWGSANFSLAVVRLMSYTRPGNSVYTMKGPMNVKSRTWPALSFQATEPSVDIGPSWPIVVGEVLSVGFRFLTEEIISELAETIGRRIVSTEVTQRGPIALVRRSAAPVTRTEIMAFDVHSDGVFVGTTSRLQIKPPLLSGLRTIPRNLAGHIIRYDVRMPFDARPDDPFLRIRWTLVDLESDSVLMNDDREALDRLSFQFNLASFSVQSNHFAVVCRVYRAVGPFATELLNETLELDVGPPLQPGAFLRWHYDVKNPQVTVHPKTEEYLYVGDKVVHRWSRFHRAHKPCKMVLERSRYTYSVETLDALPFPIHDIVGNRHRLCDYCFFGGPGSSVSFL